MKAIPRIHSIMRFGKGSFLPYLATILTLCILFLIQACRTGRIQAERPCVGDECLSLPTLVENIKNVLDSNVTGYSLVVSRGLWINKYGHGQARTPTDPPQLNFTPNTRVNLASLTKTITAVGIQQLLERNPAVDESSSIVPFLPSSWTIGPNISTITFEELLRHTGGIRQANPNQNSFSDLRATINNGINMTDKGFSYQNQNFALLAVTLPYLNGFDDSDVPSGLLSTRLSSAFINYITQNVITSRIAIDASCTPNTNSQTLYYPFPDNGSAGASFGDFRRGCGFGGMHISSSEFQKFLYQLRDTDRLLSDSQAKIMEDKLLGWYQDTIKNATYFRHGGYLFRPTPLRELNTFYASFDITDDELNTHLVLFVNSTLPNRDSLVSIVEDAYVAAWEPK